MKFKAKTVISSLCFALILSGCERKEKIAPAKELSIFDIVIRGYEAKCGSSFSANTVLPIFCKNFNQKCLTQDTISSAESENGIVGRYRVAYDYIWRFDENSEGYKKVKEVAKLGFDSGAMWVIANSSWQDKTVSFIIEQRSDGKIYSSEDYFNDSCDSKVR